MKKFLLRHVGNMGDMIFFVPPVLAAIRRAYPDCHITFVTAWGFKDRRGRWGKRNQGGFSLHLMLHDPTIDQLVHWHDTKLALDGSLCEEDGRRLPTWNALWWQEQKASGQYSGVYELDVGLRYEDNPVQRMLTAVGLPDETDWHYELYLSEADREVAAEVVEDWPRPRIVLLEGIESQTTRGWDRAKVKDLERAIQGHFGTPPIWFGARHPRYLEGRELKLRENIATLAHCDAAIGVMSGPTHFAAAVGLPTLTLFGDQPLHRAAPAYFQNPSIPSRRRQHRTLLGPTGTHVRFLKNDRAAESLTPAEATRQQHQGWQQPGRQDTKTGVSVITVDEVMAVLHDMVPV